MQLCIHLNTAQIPAIAIAYLTYVDNGTSETIKVNRFYAIPPSLFPLLTTLTVTAFSGESFTVLLSKLFNLILMVGSSFTYLVDQS
jgi:hypothetical protein